MPRVQIASYSKFYHTETRVQFQPVLDQRTGCYVGIADVDDDTAEQLAGNPAFQVLTDDEFDALSEKPAGPEAEPSETGDPLTDKAQARSKAQDLSKNKEATGGQTGTDLNGPPAPESH